MSDTKNSVLLEGNLTRDPESTSTPTGKTVTKCSIAVNEVYRSSDGSLKETVSFFDIDAWNGVGERLASFQKGDAVQLVGKLRQDRWQDAEKKNRSRVKVVVNHVRQPSIIPTMV